MVRDLTNEENQATSEPPLEDVVDRESVPSFIQFRGASTSVTVDDFNLIFTTEQRNGRIAHKPLPVATETAVKSGDAPRNAVVLPVAVELVRTNNLFGFGVACEQCGKAFETTKALDGHQSSHRDGPDADGNNEGDN
jgi:hypothetical protein